MNKLPNCVMKFASGRKNFKNMHVFYTPDIATNVEMPEEEAGHCLRVLRLTTGDEVTLTDGKGNFYKAVISAASNKRCQIKIVETLPQE